MDGTTPLVSVIMSVYNGEQWLKEAVDSIVGQTYTHWEFIIIDDASNEVTQQLLRSYTDSRIKVYRKDNQQGLTKNLNYAIGLCQGDYIARMDADDISMPGRLARQVEYFAAHPEISVVSSFIEMTDEKGNPQKPWKDDRRADNPEKIRKMLPWKNCMAHPSVLVRKKVFDSFRYNEKQVHSQDWDLWLQLEAHHVLIGKIKEPLLRYRLVTRSMTASSLKRSAFRKNHETYKNYLRLVWRQKKFNGYNGIVFTAFVLNRIKLFFSSLKRSLTS